MRVSADSLGRHLDGKLEPHYFVTGDEPLLVEEACEAILAAAGRAGFNERSMFEAGPRAAWQELFEGAANLSLFGGKRVLDVRIPARGLDRAGTQALGAYLRTPLPDTLLVCRAIGLEWRARSSAWYRALEQAAALVATRPVSRQDLPGWLRQRCRREGLTVDAEALQLLAERVEGNLLAARQEIAKLRMLGKTGDINAADVIDAVGDSSHYDMFALLDAAFAGQSARVRRMLDTLRQEGVALYAILAVMSGQLQRALAVARGGAPAGPRGRRQALTGAARRLGERRLAELGGDCGLLDMQAKGMMRGDPWQSLENILLALAGTPRPRLQAYARWLWNY